MKWRISRRNKSNSRLSQLKLLIFLCSFILLFISLAPTLATKRIVLTFVFDRSERFMFDFVCWLFARTIHNIYIIFIRLCIHNTHCTIQYNSIKMNEIYFSYLSFFVHIFLYISRCFFRCCLVGRFCWLFSILRLLFHLFICDAICLTLQYL